MCLSSHKKCNGPIRSSSDIPRWISPDNDIPVFTRNRTIVNLKFTFNNQKGLFLCRI